MRAREAAAMLLATLDRNEMVQRFLDMYAAEFRRPGRADQPAFYREQLQTIRREAILAMVMRIESSLPSELKVSVTVRGTNAQRSQKDKGKKRAKDEASESQTIDGAGNSLPRLVSRRVFRCARASRWSGPMTDAAGVLA